MSIRVAIAGVGNCASSLVQGVEYYKDTKDEDKIPGLMHNNFGGYRVRDIEFVAAFDVDADKVGKDLSEAVFSSQNNTIKFSDVPNLGVEVLRGPTLDGLGEGALALENFTKDDLPLGLDSVEFTARIAQPVNFDDFATYMDGLSCSNYAVSAMVTMSHMYESTTVKPTDMSPVCPSVSLVGYHRGKQGCYEFRMTRKTDTQIYLELYKWVRAGSVTRPELLTSTVYSKSADNKLVPVSANEVTSLKRTATYFLLYTLPDGVELYQAVLVGLDLREADLRGADLSLADLEWADLSGADLTDADLSSASTEGLILTDAILDGTKLPVKNRYCSLGVLL